MSSQTPLKICLATAEYAPLAKTGGLGDVCAALSRYLGRAGHDVRVLLPHYSSIDTGGLNIHPVGYLQNIDISIGGWRARYSIDSVAVPGTDESIYLLRCPELYGRAGIYSNGDDEHLRFILLSRVAIEMCQRMGFAPDIFHAHDWHTALIPLYLKTVYAWDRLFANTRTVLTIHNIGYQGIFGAGISKDLGLAGNEHELHQDDLSAGRINFMKTGVLHADCLTTVSPTYAREIQGSEFGMGLQDLLRQRSDTLVGILNGVDYQEWNPETDPLIPKNYSAADIRGKVACKNALMRDMELHRATGRPLVGIVSRLVSQKGIELIQRVMPSLLGRRDFALAVLGSGEPRYERYFSNLQEQFRDRVCFYRGFNNKLAHWIEAGSDIFLMPSLYEPCGLNQMYSLRYGTIPVVRETGGLADSVQLINPAKKSGTGVLFRDYNGDALNWAMNTAFDLYKNRPVWRQTIRNGMTMDFSWERQVEVYVELFNALRKKS